MASQAARKTQRDGGPRSPPAPPQKKLREPRVRLTHFEIRRGEKLRLRIAVADDTLADVGDELGALLKKVAPSVRTAVVTTSNLATPVANTTPVASMATPVADDSKDFVVTQHHPEGTTADAYHKDLREHLAALFNSLCDTALADALDLVKEERARRAEGSN